MKKIFFILLFAPGLFLSCSAALQGLSSVDIHIRDIEIGMSKAEVITVMGNSYVIIASDGQNVTLGYKTLYDNGMYKLRFENEQLKEWVKEWIYDYDSYKRKEETSINSANKRDTKHHLDAHRNSMLSTATTDAQRNAVNAHMDAHSKMVLGE